MPAVRISGLRVNYERDGSGPFIVLAHGHGSNLQYFDNLADHLKRDYTMIRYDQRGYGLSDKPPKPPYSTELWADDLYQLLRALGIEEAVVAGHSMGGRVCATFAAKHREMARGLITLNTTWFGTNPKAADELERNASLVEKEGMRVALESPWIKTIPKSLPRVLDTVVQELLRNDPASYARGTRAIAQDFRGGFREDILKAIECPTLILIGDGDSAPLDGAVKMYREIKDSRLAVIPDSGHCSTLQRPEISMAAITDFLREITSKKAR